MTTAGKMVQINLRMCLRKIGWTPIVHHKIKVGLPSKREWPARHGSLAQSAILKKTFDFFYATPSSTTVSSRSLPLSFEKCIKCCRKMLWKFLIFLEWQLYNHKHFNLNLNQFATCYNAIMLLNYILCILIN